MKEIHLPYDAGTQTLHISEDNLAGVLVSKQAAYRAEKSGAELVEDSLDHPIGSPRLEELAKGKKKYRYHQLRSHPSGSFSHYYTHSSAPSAQCRS